MFILLIFHAACEALLFTIVLLVFVVVKPLGCYDTDNVDAKAVVDSGDCKTCVRDNNL